MYCGVIDNITDITGLIVQDGTVTGVHPSCTGSISEDTEKDREQDTPTAGGNSDRERATTSFDRRGLSEVI